jgi:hypothetical protein
MFAHGRAHRIRDERVLLGFGVLGFEDPDGFRDHDLPPDASA